MSVSLSDTTSLELVFGNPKSNAESRNKLNAALEHASGIHTLKVMLCQDHHDPFEPYKETMSDENVDDAQTSTIIEEEVIGKM
jgi:hypothetical protein